MVIVFKNFNFEGVHVNAVSHDYFAMKKGLPYILFVVEHKSVIEKNDSMNNINIEVESPRAPFTADVSGLIGCMPIF